jgi:DNA polymerase-1
LSEHFEKHSAEAWIGVESKKTQSAFAESGSPLPPPVQDLGIAAFLLDPAGVHHVSALAEQQLGRSLQTWEELAGRGAKAVAAQSLEPKVLGEWSAAQAATAVALAPLLRDRLEQDGLLALHDDVEMPLTAVLSRVERNGVRIDASRLARLSQQYETDLDRIEREIYALAGEKFKVNSPKQLQQILFEKLKLPVVKKTKTGYSTDEGVLEQLASQHELPGKILAWRRLAKLKSTYVDAIPPLVNERTGRIHPDFHQLGAATGRMSASNPNVQNIPIRTEEGVRIREAFVPAEGSVLVSADYSQVELRILAHYSADESLIEAFREGEDIHRRTAAEVAEISPDQVSDDQRARAKAVNFGIIYGSSAFGLANQLGIATAEAQETIDAYFSRYQGVRSFIDETMAHAKQQGWVATWLGRRRYLHDLQSRNRVLRQAAERMAVNTVIQGTAADLIKKAMVDVDRGLAEMGHTAKMILQVHDELVFEVPVDEAAELGDWVRGCMERVFELRVPLVVDVGTGANWREAH